MYENNTFLIYLIKITTRKKSHSQSEKNAHFPFTPLPPLHWISIFPFGRTFNDFHFFQLTAIRWQWLGWDMWVQLWFLSFHANWSVFEGHSYFIRQLWFNQDRTSTRTSFLRPHLRSVAPPKRKVNSCHSINIGKWVECNWSGSGWWVVEWISMQFVLFE